MKPGNYIIITSLLLLISCKKPVIIFVEPQPEKSKNLLKIPSRIQGEYISANDSVKLLIATNLILKQYTDLDTIPNQIYTDTVFSFSEGHILKKYKGFYFLNRPFEENWEVKKLKLKQGIITIGSITTSDEITMMETITETSHDTTTPLQANPTRKQLKQFIKQKGFSDEEFYIKVN